MGVDFQDKVAIVTGAGNGIGRAEALSLAASGASVVVNDVGFAAASAVVGEILGAGGRAVAVAGDVAEWKTNAGLVAEALRSFGRLDIVVTNAGIVRRSPIAMVSEKDLDDQLAVLFKGTFGLIRHAASYWQGEHANGNRAHRTIVATSSSAGVPGGVQEFSVYGAMKSGIAALALGAALEFRDFGVTVNAILPHAATRMDARREGAAGPGGVRRRGSEPGQPAARRERRVLPRLRAGGVAERPGLRDHRHQRPSVAAVVARILGQQPVAVDAGGPRRRDGDAGLRDAARRARHPVGR